ncbi:DUF6498-containing protein [Haladaptatus cibarius]|uniref:DUF6498-containing protein n=1 Tax=Haladaptatus cibarius TaxID=453847 RepID=UPI000679CAD8|nr:DUF6498-containing protein [Haladaptatus cibarius]
MNVENKSENNCAEAVGLLLVNLMPVVGVVAFDWDILALLTFYWIEVGAVFVRTAVEGLFAGQPTTADITVGRGILGRWTGLGTGSVHLKTRIVSSRDEVSSLHSLHD